MNKNELRVNGDIVGIVDVRLVDQFGKSKGIVELSDALEFAELQNLDLVEVTPSAEPPVCRVMDYGKFTYMQGVKARESRRHQTRIVVKEVRLRPRIENHDYLTKTRQIGKFLSKGNKVKVSVLLKGREVTHPEQAIVLMQRLLADLEGVYTLDAPVSVDKGLYSAVLAPLSR